MIAHLMTSVSRGGLELYVRELILKLHAAGLKQVFICDANSFMVAEMRAHNIPVEFLEPGSRYSPLRMRRLGQIHTNYRVQVWQSHQRDDMILVALAFFFRKIRHIFSLYMGFARKKDLLHRLVYSRVEKLVTTSELMNSLALERLPVRAEQVACIRYGREEAAYKVSAAKLKSIRKIIGWKPGMKIAVSLCRLDPMKGVREFADATAHLPARLKRKFIFVQIGEPTIIGYDAHKKPVHLPESEAAFQYLRHFEEHQHDGCRYVLLPFQKDFIPYLKAADYFVLASYDEMYSLSLIDAMTAGCCIIGTNNGGTTEQLANGRGILIETKSATAIADAVARAEFNPPLRKKLQKAAATWVQNEHTWKRVLPQWLTLYNLT